MQARLRAYAVCIGCTILGAAFFLLSVVPARVPLYFPLSRCWGTVPTGELSMDYYGRSLIAVLCGLLGALVAHALLRRLRPGLTGKGLSLWTAYVLTALLLCVSLYGYKLFTRQLTPEPIPGWYQPR